MITFLFVDTERVWRGGQDQLFTLLKGLRERRHAGHLVCHPRGLLEERARIMGVAIHPLAIRSEFDVSILPRFRRLVRVIRPEVLAYNTPRAIILGNLASLGLPVKARLVFRRVNFPLHRTALTRLKYRWKIDCIVAISESIRSQLQAGGVPEDRIRTIYEGIDLQAFPRSEGAATGTEESRLTVGTVAHLSPEKGLQYLVEAAARIPRAAARMRFVLVGEGECRSELERQVARLGLEDCFRFEGFQDRPLEYLRRFDIFVLPSLSEGLSSAILNAMAAGLPVIATSVGGIPELVGHGRNGLLVGPGDAEALAAAIESLAGSAEERRRMGREGRARIEERYTLDRKITETERLCEALVSGRTES